MLKFFPTDPGVQAAIMELLRDMVPSKDALEKLTAKVSLLSEWPGPGELRGLLCTFIAPADGIDVYCNLPGYRAYDCEQRAIEQAQEWKELPAPNRKAQLKKADPVRLVSRLREGPKK